MAAQSSDALPKNSLHNPRGAIPLNDAFERLRWSIFEDVSRILVLDEPESRSPGLSPFEGHTIAAEPASEIPLTEIAFSIDELNEFHANGIPGFQRPKPVLVSRADGGTVTVADVVQQLSVYFLSHKEDILTAKEAYLEESTSDCGTDDEQVGTTTIGKGHGAHKPANRRVFFDGFFGIIEPTMKALPVLLWAKGEGSSSLDDRLLQ
jgi:hypothetical protein